MCEEFGCLPSAAEHELNTNFERVIDVLWTRQYARVKAAVDAAKTKDDIPIGPMADLVQETAVDIWRARKGRGDG